MEQPLRIALQYFGDLRFELLTGLTKTVDYLAEMCLINSQHLCHSVLAQATGVDPQLQVWIDVTMNWHCI